MQLCVYFSPLGVMLSFVVEALTFAVKCLFIVSTVGAVKFLSTKPARGVVSLNSSPMDRYREVYARVFDLISHKGGVVDRAQVSTGHGFVARRYNQIRAVRASVIVTSTVAAMSAVTAIQNIYNTALDDIARLPRGRLLPLTTVDVRPSNLDSPMRSPGELERYSDYFVAARSVFEAAVNATKVLVLFESLCVVNALVSGKRFIDHRRASAQRGTEVIVAQHSAFSDNTPDSHVERSTTHSGDNPVPEIRKSPQMAVKLAIVANKYYSSLWKRKKKGLDASMSSVFSCSSDSEKESKLGGMATVTDDSAKEEKTQSVVPPSFRRRNTVLKKLGAKKDYMKGIHATIDAREKVVEKGKAFVDAVPFDKNTYEQSSKVSDVVQGLRRRNTAFRNGCIQDTDRYSHVKVAGRKDPVAVEAVFEESTCAKPSVEHIVQDLQSRGAVATGDLFDKTTANSALNLEGGGEAAPFSFDDTDIVCTEVVVDDLSSSPVQRLAKMEEGVLHSASSSSAQDAARCDDASTMEPDSVGNSCTVHGKQAAVIRPFSVSSAATSDEVATQRQRVSFSDLRSRVKEQVLRYASGMFVSCYTAAVMHMSLYFSLCEKYRNPTARSRYSDLLYDDELDVINGMPVEDFVSPVVHACRVSLSTTGRNNHTHRSSR